jgi:nitrous-oxide reductase
MQQKSRSVARGWKAWAAMAAVGAVVVVGCSQGAEGDLNAIIEDRGLSVEQAEGALLTYVPPGEYDPYIMVSSGGHSGSVHLVGLPSMRMLKTIPVFTPESWSGYGQGSDLSELVLAEGSSDKQAATLAWGDTHHPAISETAGEYDGRWVYIQDRANGRLGFIELKDFKTKQIIDIPNAQTTHGGAFVTPNSEYIHVSAMTPIPWTDNDYAPLDEYAEKYRGVSSFLAIDPDNGRIELDRSFQLELPPYTHDLSDAGKLGSEGLVFIGSYNTEMAIGGISEGGVPLEVGASANDFDFLHVIDWKLAEQVVADGQFIERNGMRVIPLQTVIDEGLLHLIREPRSPHGADVDPTGNYVVVAGKLDPQVSVYDIDEIRTAIADENYEGTDTFGIPILDFDAVLAGQVEVGLGPLHTQFDGKGNGMVSLFLDSAVAKFSLGEKAGIAAEDAFKLIDKVNVNYNIGHLAATEGDTVAADGKYVVALNKWSIDRFPVLGTLKPQNFQLIENDTESMRVIYDMPVGFGEPHYAQIMRADRLTSAIETYEPGTEPLTMGPSDVAVISGDERIDTSTPGEVHVYMSATRSHFTPDIIRVKQGDEVFFHVTNIETIPDATHGFAIPGYNVQASLDAGEVVSVSISADKPGSYAFYCTEFCSALHLEMQGWLLVEPSADVAVAEPVDVAVAEPAEEPTAEPAEEPTEAPVVEPTEAPAEEPTEAPVVEPTQAPVVEPTAEATAEVTAEPIEPVVVPDGGTAEIIGNGFRYDPPALSISSAGSATIRLVNRDVVEHDYTIGELDIQIEAPVGGSGEATLSGIAPGTYRVYCTIPGHEAAGMVGSLVVSA